MQQSLSDRVSPRIQWTVWGGLALTVLTVCLLFVLTRMQRGQTSFPVYGQLPDFSLTNQAGSPVSLETLRGNVVIADIIFTRCAGPCPEMTKKLSELQTALPASAPVKLVTLTTDPAFDTPQVLKSYAARFGADSNRWWFLTGTKPQIGNLATNGFKLTAFEVPRSEQSNEFDLFVHSTMFVLLDKQGRLRGALESAAPDWREKAVEGVEALLKEKHP